MQGQEKVYVFVPKQGEANNPYFSLVRRGCEYQAEKIGVKCVFEGPVQPNAMDQLVIVRKYIQLLVDGIAISSLDDRITRQAVEEASLAGIPVITFDSDAPESRREHYVGTDNFAFGKALGKILLQLKPKGGQYAVISATSQNLRERLRGIRSFLDRSGWEEIEESPSDCQDSIHLALEQTVAFSNTPGIDAVLSVGGWPMFHENPERWKSAVDRHMENITYVIADTMPMQIDLLTFGHVHGLVGQDPYLMGVQGIDILHHPPEVTDSTVLGTAFIEMVRVPLGLPPADVDYNHLGNVRFLGLVFFAVIVLLTVSFSIWTCMKQNLRVVLASQPQFLLMVCAGVLICGSALVPLSMDDSDPNFTGVRANRACQSIPWLSSIGFTIMFSALFAKTWRINKIFHHPFPNARLKIHSKDLYLPFATQLSTNVLCLVGWTMWNPIRYERRPHNGTDEWNRVISTYGRCSSTHSAFFIFTLAAINISGVILANWQAYEARHIQSEFSESKYIALSMACILQAALTGVPIMYLTKEMPQVNYVVTCMTMFIACMAVLLLIFVPKIQSAWAEHAMVRAGAEKHMEAAVQRKLEQQMHFGSMVAQIESEQVETSEHDKETSAGQVGNLDDGSWSVVSGSLRSMSAASLPGSFSSNGVKRRRKTSSEDGLVLARMEWSVPTERSVVMEATRDSTSQDPASNSASCDECRSRGGSASSQGGSMDDSSL